MSDVSSQMVAAASSATISVTSLVVSSLGPLGGQLCLIGLGAVAGATWALGKREKDATPGAFVFMVRLILASVVLATAASYGLERFLGLPYFDCLLVTSFLVSAFSDLWPKLVDALINRAASRIS